MIRKDYQAEALGLSVKNHQIYHLSSEQVDQLKAIREAEKMGIPVDKLGKFSNSPYYWDKSKEHSFFVKESFI